MGATEFETEINGFTELEVVGGVFTWANGTMPNHTRSRLDRALGNPLWIARWPQVRPMLILDTTSDHAGLHIQLTQPEKGSSLFKFFNSCLRDDEFNSEFKDAWATSIEARLPVLHPPTEDKCCKKCREELGAKEVTCRCLVNEGGSRITD